LRIGECGFCDCGLAIADFVIADWRMRFSIADWDRTIDSRQSQSTITEIRSRQSQSTIDNHRNPHSSIRNPQST